ncbi:Acetyltransferase (GNAT) family protein [Saccharopolyspora antimicrobica]|uniref:Acetyltransferase (GNAT) family protein n=1 Tax=Saccharopolyspora antimicrobica TaxID=455193 RepID=A0A1I5F5A4_9PSEU|nr:GNAT family N-acetyltransferase [Saccharopolyspora antimicrobica]RKT83683.1 FR47-like protein [Saccharopolyspora antimicrobica]SFO18799.1 Acetyltransferase (GNAT) family protein [Saccharopolyspora antimicrobica]
MRELRSAAEVGEVTDDLLVRWAAQALVADYPHAGGAAWQHRSAVVVHAPALNQNNRVVFSGSAEDCAELLAEVLPGLRGEKLRPLARTALAHRVSGRLGLEVLATFGWMQLATAPPTAPAPNVEWLTRDDEQAVESLLRKANPRSYLFPGDPGARRWAGIRGADGTVLSVGGDCWPAPGVRYLSGVATHPDHRGAGLSTAVCTFLTRELAREGAVALMADADNEPALKVYRRLGFRYHSISALAG